MSLKNERDSLIRSLFKKHHLGSLPSDAFNDEVASNLTDRIQSKLKNLLNDLQEKKVLLSFSEINFDMFQGYFMVLDSL